MVALAGSDFGWLSGVAAVLAAILVYVDSRKRSKQQREEKQANEGRFIKKDALDGYVQLVEDMRKELGRTQGEVDGLRKQVVLCEQDKGALHEQIRQLKEAHG